MNLTGTKSVKVACYCFSICLFVCRSFLSEPEMEIDHKEAYPSQQQLPAVQSQTQQQLKKKTSPHSSDDESHNLFFLMSSDEDSSEDEEEEEEEELDESLEAGLSEDEDAENSEQSETMYRRRYWFLKRLAKRIIFVCNI